MLVTGWKNTRIVRRGEIDVQEIGFRVPLPDQLDGRIRDVAVSLRCEANSLLQFNPALVAFERPTDVPRCRASCMIRHCGTSWRRPTRGKQPAARFIATFRGLAVIVPLAAIPRAIACRAQRPRPGGERGIDRCAAIAHAIAERRRAGEQLGAADMADGIGRHGSREHKPLADQRVEVRRLDLHVPWMQIPPWQIRQCTNGILPHVIGQNEKDVRPGRHTISRPDGGRQYQ